jgi:hypothetical protein
MNIKSNKNIKLSKIDESFDTNFSENQSPNNSITIDTRKPKKKTVSFNIKIEIIEIKCYKKQNKINSIPKQLIKENLRNYRNLEDVYRPNSQNCFGCYVI